MTVAARSSGRTSLSEPLKARPNGERAVETMTASVTGSSCADGPRGGATGGKRVLSSPDRMPSAGGATGAAPWRVRLVSRWPGKVEPTRCAGPLSARPNGRAPCSGEDTAAHRGPTQTTRGTHEDHDHACGRARRRARSRLWPPPAPRPRLPRPGPRARPRPPRRHGARRRPRAAGHRDPREGQANAVSATSAAFTGPSRTTAPRWSSTSRARATARPPTSPCRSRTRARCASSRWPTRCTSRASALLEDAGPGQCSPPAATSSSRHPSRPPRGPNSASRPSSTRPSRP